jgi:hypothetical protein
VRARSCACPRPRSGRHFHRPFFLIQSSAIGRATTTRNRFQRGILCQASGVISLWVGPGRGLSFRRRSIGSMDHPQNRRLVFRRTLIVELLDAWHLSQLHPTILRFPAARACSVLRRPSGQTRTNSLGQSHIIAGDFDNLNQGYAVQGFGVSTEALTGLELPPTVRAFAQSPRAQLHKHPGLL